MVLVKSALLASVALFSSYTAAVTPLAVRGASIVNVKDGSRFQMIGVAYQPGGAAGYKPGTGKDPLSNKDICMRDATVMQRLGLNTVRVYNLDPAIDHSACVSIYNAAGIYLLIDVNSPIQGESLNRLAPWEDYYTPAYTERVLKIVHEFMGYDNTFGFFSANEIINEESVEQVPQFIRAATRDIKQYLAKHAKREIPVGYSAADVRPLLMDTYNYLECNTPEDPWSKMDFFGLNSYSWCGNATAKEAGYDKLTEDFASTTVPVFFSEYGCNKVAKGTARPFTEVAYLYASPMMNVFSGGIAYEFTEEDNEYGLVKWAETRLDLLDDYTSFRTQLGLLNVAALSKTNATSSNLQTRTCSDVTISSNITSNFTVPFRPAAIQTFINDGVVKTAAKTLSKISSAPAVNGVYGPNGAQVSGLQLQILADGESNLPNSRQATNPDGTAIAPAVTPTATSAAPATTSSEGAAMREGAKLGYTAILASLAGLALW